MKFLCERCKTKYSIADEKVRRKILKIRCKNCANIITVRDPESHGDESATEIAAPVVVAAGGSGRMRAAKPGGGAAASATAPVASSLAGALEQALGEAGRGQSDQEENQTDTDDEEWYVGIDGVQQGPMPFARLSEMVDRGSAREDAF